MSWFTPEITSVLPELFLLGMSSVLLLVHLFHAKHGRRVIYYLSQVILLGTMAFVYLQFNTPTQIIFHKSLIIDNISVILKGFVLITSLVAFLYSNHYIQERRLRFGEYYLLALFSILGMMVLISSYNLISLYLGLELLSLPLYALVAIQRDDSMATEAAIKFFIMGGDCLSHVALWLLIIIWVNSRH